MITQYGMSEVLGLVTFEAHRHATQMSLLSMQGQKEYSEQTAQIIDEEIQKLLLESHDRVKETLAKKRKLLEDLKSHLIEKEVVERQILEQLIKKHENDHEEMESFHLVGASEHSRKSATSG